jgi:hypothetical protein
MSNLNTFLKVINKMGYPNPDTKNYASYVDYNLYDMLSDMVDEVGYQKTNEFTIRALDKISEGDRGIKIPLGDSDDDYVYLQIHNSSIDLNEVQNCIIVDWSFGESKIFDPNDETYKTLDEMYEDIGMGEWGEWEEMIDDIKDWCYDYIMDNCGFGIWYGKQI